MKLAFSTFRRRCAASRLSRRCSNPASGPAHLPIAQHTRSHRRPSCSPCGKSLRRYSISITPSPYMRAGSDRTRRSAHSSAIAKSKADPPRLVLRQRRRRFVDREAEAVGALCEQPRVRERVGLVKRDIARQRRAVEARPGVEVVVLDRCEPLALTALDHLLHPARRSPPLGPVSNVDEVFAAPVRVVAELAEHEPRGLPGRARPADRPRPRSPGFESR